MKKFATTSLLVLISLFSQDTALSQRTAASKPAPITLTFQPPSGELHEIVMEWMETENVPPGESSITPVTLGQTVTARKVSALWRVLDRDTKGSTVIEITYKYIRSAQTIGRVVDAVTFFVKNEGTAVVWDTRRSTAELNPRFARIAEMEQNQTNEFFTRYLKDVESVRQALASYLIDRPIRIVIDKQGRITDIQDMDLLLDEYRTESAKLTKDFETRARQDAIVTGFLGEDAIRQSFTVSQLVPFSATPVTVGQKWSDTHEFNVLGRRVPLNTEFSITECFPAGYCEVSGRATYSVATRPNEKDLEMFSAATMTALVDMQTGMFEILKQEGNVKVSRTAASTGLSPRAELSVRFEGTTRVRRLATRSTTDPGKWRFSGGYPNEDFYILLGERWYRTDPIAPTTETDRYVDSNRKTSITAAILPQGHLNILNSKADIPLYLEWFTTFQIPTENMTFKMIKTFRTGNVDWYRARIDVKYKAGFGEHMVVQAGFDGTRFFVFYLRAGGNDFERELVEATAALDSIEIRKR